jgi:uncharacterized repeat protein (TIGR03803 family)
MSKLGLLQAAGIVFALCITTAIAAPAQTFNSLVSFNGTNGAEPGYVSLVQGRDGNYYGTTESGGAYYSGTVFKITPSGTLTTLYSFCSQNNCPDGYITRGLVQATDGNFYGTTYEGGTSSGECGATGCGTVFEITPAGTLTTLYNFDMMHGEWPSAGLMQGTDGNLYGTTYEGGAYGYGTIFQLSVGLGRFIETEPTSGKVGAAVIILGNNLTGTTGVSFNGTSAKFTVVSNTEITTSVPAGATTGKVEVTTPKGKLKSNVVFRVTPQIKSFNPTSGSVGTQVTIYGVSLTQTTKVTFGGVKASQFTVNSDTQVTAYVPTGAKTGHIRITTPGGTSTSSGIFTVTQ